MDKVGATEGFKGPGLLGKGAMIRFGIRIDHNNWYERKNCKNWRETSWEATAVVQAKDKNG